MTFSKQSPFQLSLLQSTREWLVVLGVLFCVGSMSLYVKYTQYQHFKAKKPVSLHAQVRLQYSKLDSQGRSYFVLQLKDAWGNVFYTTSKENLKDLSYAFVRAYGKMATSCSFFQFLKSCYFHTFYLALESTKDTQSHLRTFINAQHTDARMGNFYNTLFLAQPLDKPTRELAMRLGISHIIAISGFHLGILGAFFYALLFLPYRFLQQRYFPYRNAHYDLGVCVFVLLFGYLVLLDFQPSFLRAFVMALLGFGLYYCALHLLNFTLLGLAILLCLTLFPNLIINTGFLLSVCGVFYIYLFLKHIPRFYMPLYALFFNTALFICMLPIVHAFFTPFSLYQLSGIILSFVFVIFFPLSLILHALGWGALFDPYLLAALEWQIPSINYHTPPWFLMLYLGLSLLAMRSKYAYRGLYLTSGGLFIILAWRVF
ncbi:ComEC/Rec2 family competence protein [Helicobacter salomonis]|uniref:ComEC/Rec2 family competence protein n=1 Tax=Helicobacter salomonis TaxID=56878 RepID=UPI0018F838E0|nr:ComEC/Rec2 family competence protein [Helicobacter salomonis]